MKEVFLHYLWENKLLHNNLQTTDNEQIQIISTGLRSSDSGPDFLNARIKIGETIWAGNVEIHLLSSDWNKHEHDKDKAYTNVILHVVYKNDTQVFTAKGNSIPTLELKDAFDENIYLRYQSFLESQNWIACEDSIDKIQKFTLLTWLDRLVVERLEHKIDFINQTFQKTNSDWEETFFRLLLKNFGLKVNSDAFERLAVMLPLKVLLKHSDNLLQLEAILFGVAGFLENDFVDDYPKLLQREFNMLKSKFDLHSMPCELWRFMRMRPSNFPTIRLAQLASLIHENGNLFSKIKNAENIEQLKNIFQAKTSVYWETHFMFDKSSTQKVKKIGESITNLIIINSIAPLLFYYGKKNDDKIAQEKTLFFLENADVENNNIIRNFESFGVKAENALQSQALIQMHNNYCKLKRCLECRIGYALMCQK